jgi:hypothetical protein
MDVCIQRLRHAGDLQEILRKDGWHLDDRPENEILAKHPQVLNESAARSRLQHLGLLTAGFLRIEFRRSGSGWKG